MTTGIGCAPWGQSGTVPRSHTPNAFPTHPREDAADSGAMPIMRSRILPVATVLLLALGAAACGSSKSSSSSPASTAPVPASVG